MTTDNELVVNFLTACWERRIKAVTAESCTGGMVASMITDVGGASAVFDRGFVTYSNAAKVEQLGVSEETLERFGAVSQQTAIEMAAGALQHSHAGIALSVTGIAGPDGGSEEKPVGTVWFGVAVEGRKALAIKRIFENDGRAFIRSEAAKTALQYGLEALRAG